MHNFYCRQTHPLKFLTADADWKVGRGWKVWWYYDNILLVALALSYRKFSR